MHHLGVIALARASFYVYTRLEDIDALAEGIQRVQKVFA
jgi:selenocysteine lyase/cysteine desulfurase